MEKPSNRFDQDELDEAVIAADDTGLVSSQHDIAEEGLLEATDTDEETPEEQG